MKLSDEPLVCNQIECHPFLDQSKVRAACQKHGMAVVAYSPIARGGAEGDKVLTKIGKAHGKTAAQVSLRYLVQHGMVVIPRTSKAERLKENIDIFDFELDGRGHEGDRRARRPARPHCRLGLFTGLGLTWIASARSKASSSWCCSA